jgi:hypothetical protein
MRTDKGRIWIQIRSLRQSRIRIRKKTKKQKKTKITNKNVSLEEVPVGKACTAAPDTLQLNIVALCNAL